MAGFRPRPGPAAQWLGGSNTGDRQSLRSALVDA
jgi:hypothetical protein